MSSRGSSRARERIRVSLRKLEDVCWLCGLPLQDDAPPYTDWATEIDEDIPVSKGGDPLGRNTELHLVHRCCNIRKSGVRCKPGSLREFALEKKRSQATSTWFRSSFL